MGRVEDEKNRSDHQHHHPPPPFHGGVSNSNYPPQQPNTQFQQPAQPYVSGHAVQGRREADDPLPCFGIGIGWLLFILGFLFGALPWYVGFFLLICNKDPREKPGCIACAVAAAIITVIIIALIVSS